MIRKINLLFIGDIVGEEALVFFRDNLEQLKTKYKSNFIVVNGENIKDGKGLTEVEAEFLFGLGVRVITTGNHVWDNWKARPLLSRDSRVIRPLNYPRIIRDLDILLLTSMEKLQSLFFRFKAVL